MIESLPAYVALSERLATAGQPSQAQFAEVARAGFDVVINLALHDDPSYSLPDERRTVESLGMRYVHIPVQFASPTLEQLAQFSEAMAQAQGWKVFVHCRHNKRVPVFVALDRVRRQGWTPHDAFAAMEAVWMPDETWRGFIDKALAERDRDCSPG